MKFTKLLFGLCCIALLSCSIVSAIEDGDPGSGAGETHREVYQGELTTKYIGADGNHYVNLYNEDDGISYNSLIISTKKYKNAHIGNDYEWTGIYYPDGKRSYTLHRI